MDSFPNISIVIPTYNHGHLINRCLKSVVKQTYTDWEAIIVNNFSGDDTIDVIRRFNDTRLQVVNFHNNGIIAASRNRGIRLTKGRYIAFLDSDDWWRPEKLAISVKYIDSDDVVFHDLDIYTPNGRKKYQKFRGRHLTKPVVTDLLSGGNALATSSVVLRKSIINKACGFDENKDLVSIEDFDLWLKIAGITDRFRYIPRTLGSYWIGGQNTNQMSDRKIGQMKEIYKKYSPLLTESERKQADLHLAYAIGRIKQKTGNWQEALELFQISIKSKNNKDKFKSLFFGAVIGIFHSLSVKF